jgi:regulator of protease activity HflC (stomatin/prohibitin superfamily)
MKSFQELLIELNACEPARRWAGDKTIEQVVQECHQGDWLLWLAKRVGVELQPLTLAKGHCANTVRHLMTDERSLKAVDTAIAFGESKATRKELCKAAASAYAAVAAAAAYAASAYAAAAAADATYDAAAAAASADAAAADAARKANQLQTADICRKYIGDLIVKNVTQMLEEGK